MGYTCFDISESDGVAHVRLNRPDQLNTMIAEFWSELPQIIDEISSLGRARVIVISSTGKHFCAGMDLSVFTGDNSLTAGDAEVGRLRALPSGPHRPSRTTCCGFVDSSRSAPGRRRSRCGCGGGRSATP